MDFFHIFWKVSVFQIFFRVGFAIIPPMKLPRMIAFSFFDHPDCGAEKENGTNDFAFILLLQVVLQVTIPD
jgi:hypothetical protein